MGSVTAKLVSESDPYIIPGTLIPIANASNITNC